MENKSYAVPVVVAVAIIIIVSAIFFYKPSINADSQVAALVESLNPLLQPAEDISLDSFRELDNSDKIWGDSNAPIKLVIYSDLECPACAWFHGQLKDLSDYVDEGTIAVAFRHLPLESIHLNAKSLAIAAECADSIGGNEKFWQFIDFIFSANEKDSVNLINDAAKVVGLETTKIEGCLIKEEALAVVTSHSLEAVTLGAQGTPFMILSGPNGLRLPIFGGRETNNLKAAIDLILKDDQTATKPIEEPVITPTEEATTMASTTSTEN